MWKDQNMTVMFFFFQGFPHGVYRKESTSKLGRANILSYLFSSSGLERSSARDDICGSWISQQYWEYSPYVAITSGMGTDKLILFDHTAFINNAGDVGYMDPGRFPRSYCSLSVGIRCIHLPGNHVTVFFGCGPKASEATI